MSDIRLKEKRTKLSPNFEKDTKMNKSAGKIIDHDISEVNPKKTPKKRVREHTINTGLEIPAGRGGRIRKAKVVFDPSDEYLSKRAKGAISSPEPVTAAKPLNKSIEVKKELPLRRSIEPPVKLVEKRRNTIAASARHVPIEFANGCIICSRSDAKKGRFVYCMDCSSRGHFTCLRNGKYIATSDEENSWQCFECQTCGICYESSLIDKLFKCIACLTSYHLSCQKNQPANVKKRQFKCENCYELENMQNIKKAEKKNFEKSFVDKNVFNKKKTTNGFAGFSQEDATIKSIPSTSTSNQLSSSAEGIHQQTTEVLKDEVHVKSEIKMSPEGSVTYNQDQEDLLFDDQEQIPPFMEGLELKLGELTDVETQDSGPFQTKKDRIYEEEGVFKAHERFPDVKRWDCDEIFTYFMGTTTSEYAHIFKENEIDGDALLLINREDVLTKFNLKLGPALRLYSHILTLQFKNNNPILGWDED